MTRKILTLMNKYWSWYKPRNRESELFNAKLSSFPIRNVSIFFITKSRTYNPQDGCQQGRKGSEKLQQEIVSVYIWTRLTRGTMQWRCVYIWTQPLYCRWWVFTRGPSPVIVPQLPPSTSHPFYQSNITIFSGMGVYIRTQPSCWPHFHPWGSSRKWKFGKWKFEMIIYIS